MKYSTCLAIVLALLTVPSVFGDDQQKAEKQIKRISAMAADATGHRLVSATIADMLQIKRPELVQQRLKMNLSYGSLFLAHQLAANGADMTEIAKQLQGGKTIVQVANDQNAKWKQIFTAAKKLNGKIEEHVYSHFIDDKPDKARDEADHYDPFADVVQADNDVSVDDLDAARDVYVRWRDLADQRAGRQGSRLGTADEQVARQGHDPIKTGAPVVDHPPSGPH